MKKQIFLYSILLLAVPFVSAWQETRVPLSLWEGYMHYPLERDRELNDFGLDIDFWTGLYWRTAPNAYNNNCGGTTLVDDCCCGSKESLGQLYFGQETFMLSQAFANSTVPAAGTITNPFVSTSPLTINVDYREQGVWFGTALGTRFGCENEWSTGLRIRIPFRDIQVVPRCGNPVETAALDSLASNTGSILAFTNQVGLNACYGNTRGMGDLNPELYFGYDWTDWGYLEGRLGFIAPTGIKVYNPAQILKFPTGNNGHPEVMLGVAGGIERLRYLMFNFDFYYSFVTPSSNSVATPFSGACVKNVGPCIVGDTSWSWGLCNVNINLINPYYECMGVMFGYQAYFKQKDKLTLCETRAFTCVTDLSDISVCSLQCDTMTVGTTQALDWANTLQLIDTSVYTRDTDRVAHRIRTETFFEGTCFNAFLGFVATVGGKNVPAEVDFHVGLDVYF